MNDPGKLIRQLDDAIERGEISDEDARRYFEEARQEAVEETENDWGA